MLKKTELRCAALGWIKELPSGAIFSNKNLYNFLEKEFPLECKQRGDAAHEPQFRNDARWAVHDAKEEQLAKDTGKIGEHQRL